MHITPVSSDDCFGLVRPAVDAHTLGISYVSQLLQDCGYKVHIADASVCSAIGEISKIGNIQILIRWLREHEVTFLGFSYRLDPRDAQEHFGRLIYQLKSQEIIGEQRQIKRIYFAGLPEACSRIQREYCGAVTVFDGDDSPAESLKKMGVPEHRIPLQVIKGSEYDDWRIKFGEELILKGDHLGVKPVDRSGYESFGTKMDTVLARIDHGRKNEFPPLIRVHAGPYNPRRRNAIKEFEGWAKKLANSGYLDILSIGTSQLTQSRFGEDWHNDPNGGGVPVNSAAEYRQIWNAARPMLVRTYAGTKDIRSLARMHEETLNIAWHALSFWWFCQIDGRGPNDVYQNLKQHLETLKFIAESGKPFEPNIPHHFAFRGGDDISCALSAYLAAKTAKLAGVRTLVLQVMMNTPKHTWGIQDLAKARALLSMVRELESPTFRILLQPRAGLDYFSPNMDKAKAQLAAVTALMDDIEPLEPSSPDIIHVVSYSEASHLADPDIIDESIKITQGALAKYRLLKKLGNTPDMHNNIDVRHRTASLIRDVKILLREVEHIIRNTYSVAGLYKVFQSGFMPVPYLWECREEFKRAVEWKTGIVDGGVAVLKENGDAMSIEDRIALIKAKAGVF
jgi:hypothetical protein